MGEANGERFLCNGGDEDGDDGVITLCGANGGGVTVREEILMWRKRRGGSCVAGKDWRLMV